MPGYTLTEFETRLAEEGLGPVIYQCRNCGDPVPGDGAGSFTRSYCSRDCELESWKRAKKRLAGTAFGEIMPETPPFGHPDPARRWKPEQMQERVDELQNALQS